MKTAPIAKPVLYPFLLQIFDKNNDGFITSQELREVMHHMGNPVTSVEIEAIINEADLDKDGKIDYTEFFLMVNKETSSSYAASALASAMEGIDAPRLKHR